MESIMKKLLTILMLIFSCTFVKAQKETVAGELSIWIDNNPQNKTVSLTLELVSPACWDENHYITELFNGGTVSGGEYGGWLEFLVCWETFYWEYYRTFGLGLYKITAKIDNVVKDHFFIDYRTSDLPEAIGVGCQIDYALDFNVGTEKFYYRNTQDEFSGYHAFWDLRPCVELRTDGLEDYWDNSLAVISSSDNHPLAVWGPFPRDQTITEVTYYEIWRKYGSGNWTYLGYVSGNTFTYEDEELTVAGQQSGTTVLYKIRAVQTALPENLLSNYSNTASIIVSGEDPGKRNFGNYEVINISSIELFQNYPNPFNPTTTIKYSIPVSSQVSLKIFDIIGSEVATLVNEQQEAGTFLIEFDASKLTSGIYFYQIQAGKYLETRKLILQK